MSKRFEFERFDLRACACDECDMGITPQPEFDGDWVKAQDALNRESVLQAQIRTLEAQLKDTRALLEAGREQRGNPGEEAMQRGCADLPDGYQIHACMEAGAGWVDVYGPDGEKVDYSEDSDSGMTGRINDAIDMVIKADKEFEDLNKEPV